LGRPMAGARRATPPLGYNRAELMLTLREKLGQLLIVGIDSDGWEQEIEDFLREIQPGGVIFFQRNIKAASEFRRLAQRIREFLKTPPFLALDQEGGLVDRLRDVLAPLPAARDVARAGLGEEMGRIAGRELAAFSLNVDFAPVLDLGAPESRKILGSRTAGDTPEEVVRFARSFLQGLSQAGVAGCGKHFPGLGSGQKDSHKELPAIEKEERKMWYEDLAPFRELAPELPMIMIAHAYCPGLESSLTPGIEGNAARLPATLSPRIVSDLLKGRMGFQGLALSDDLEMGGVLEGRSMEQAAMAALQAGCDVLLLCGAAAHTRNVFDFLLREANSDPRFRAVVEQAAEKVLLAKEKLGITTGNRDAAPELLDFDALRQEIAELSAAVERRLQAGVNTEGG
jgi:beta-N-acetylhexosaminidase